MQTTALFIFRRDLRLNDNTALLAALEQADRVVPCFIFDPAQVGNANHYKSSNALQFMVESLDDLAAQLAARGGKLHLFYGNPSDVVATLIAQEGISAVYVNNDYTPFSVKRDKALAAVCKKHDVDFCAYDDALLNPPAAACKKDGTPYSVFTPYFNNASTIPVPKPVQNRHTNYGTVSQKEIETKTILDTVNNDLFVRGGRAEAKKILAGLERYRHYEQERDLPAVAGTTGLAAHLKFGTCSVREAYYAIVDALGKQHCLIKQLYWRDFFTHVAHFSPHVFGHAFNQSYEHIKWQNNMHHFKRWCQGLTGFPIVDAGMRQLNATGWMHNRVRMIVASFLVKDLHIDWRMGEQYFAIKLVDYDPAVNNGNWQWAASTGCDAQPYFRIFNPWLQQQKFDPTCAYIKQWVPELAKLSPAHIHTWDKTSVQPAKPYPKPIVDHAVVSKEAIALFKKYEK
jgi:deoxyribodipyrimidine photo-lyase